MELHGLSEGVRTPDVYGSGFLYLLCSLGLGQLLGVLKGKSMEECSEKHMRKCH